MRLMSSTSWEGIFTTIWNLFHTFMFYIFKFTYLYHSRFFLIIFFSSLFSKAGYRLIVFCVSQYFANYFTKYMAKSEKLLMPAMHYVQTTMKKEGNGEKFGKKNRVGLCWCTQPLVLMWSIYVSKSKMFVIPFFFDLIPVCFSVILTTFYIKYWNGRKFFNSIKVIENLIWEKIFEQI